LGDVGNVIASGDEGEFVRSFGADLGETNGGREGVADALAAEGFLGSATFATILFDGFSGAAVANGAVIPAVEVP